MSWDDIEDRIFEVMETGRKRDIAKMLASFLLNISRRVERLERLAKRTGPAVMDYERRDGWGHHPPWE